VRTYEAVMATLKKRMAMVDEIVSMQKRDASAVQVKVLQAKGDIAKLMLDVASLERKFNVHPPATVRNGGRGQPLNIQPYGWRH
jgi:hypothetical protein